MSPLAWALYLFAPPQPRVLTWPLDHLAARARPVAPSPTASASTTADLPRLPSAGAPCRQTCTVLTADGAELWEMTS